MQGLIVLPEFRILMVPDSGRAILCFGQHIAYVSIHHVPDYVHVDADLVVSPPIALCAIVSISYGVDSKGFI
jgi:hypothetical protein